MCTVSFIPTSFNDFILTSNRDEAPVRKTIPPQQYTFEDVNMVFPKDAVAGGTWIGISEKKRLMCLLNGGFTAHTREDEYRMSRGVVVTQLLATLNVLEAIEAYDFFGIEPFTVILVTWEEDLQLFELVWDGQQKHLAEKPIAPTIWSSSLLYSEAMKKEREQWFSNFLFDNLKPNKEKLLYFHKTAGTGNPDSDLIMDRQFVRTKSITQLTKQDKMVKMRYEDLQTNSITDVNL